MNTNKKIIQKNKIPLLWASVLRIVATLCIFLFHFFVLYNKPTFNLAGIGLSIFFFLAGWFGAYADKSPHQWLVNRLKRIMIPYWPVIFVVLVTNHIVGYKETTLINDILTFCGFSLFLEKPVYVISWFITFIIMLDLSLYGFRLIKNQFISVFYLLLTFLIFEYLTPDQIVGLLVFYLGFFLNRISKNWPGIDPILSNRYAFYSVINIKLFKLQNYAYSFFLVHAAILIFLVHAVKLNATYTLVFGFLLSSVVTYIHNRLLKKYS